MATVSIINAKDNLSRLISEVNDSSIPLTIVNDSGKNAVLLSEDDWNSIQETLYLHSVPGMAESIIRAGHEALSECTAYDLDGDFLTRKEKQQS